jgi:transcriptional regulator with XRE-family HTH domain
VTAPGPEPLHGWRLRDYDDLLRALRRAWLSLGLTQAQLGETVSLSRAQVANVFLGKSETPARKMLDLADALGYDLALIPRDAEPQPAQCSKCGNALSACTDCGLPAQCGDSRCSLHSPDGEWPAPPSPLSATESGETASPRGGGCAEPPRPAEAAVDCGCLLCRSLRDDFPPLQETYPGSGTYE